MRFQDRDTQILWSIYKNDGFLAKRQLKQMYWPDKSWRAMEQRLSKLHAWDYLDWPSREQRKFYPVPEPVCWLGWRGAVLIAGIQGIRVEPPKNDKENQLRLLQKALHDQGIRWMREPRWSVLAHDLAVVDFRLAVEKAIKQLSKYTLEKWLPEGEFRSNMDVVQLSTQDRNGRIIRMKRGVCPDAYFEINHEVLRMQGKPHKARFLLEMDMATHDNPSFGRYKAAPGVAYIRSETYKRRFGSNHGVWLVVTNGGKKRLNNLMHQTAERVGDDARFFYFTTIQELKICPNILILNIWHQIGENDPKPLFIQT